jgi:class 3 adenylate cyclase
MRRWRFSARLWSTRRHRCAGRLEYTVIGDPDNEAARLSGLAKADDGHVLASNVALRCALDLVPLLWDIGELVELRGRAAEVEIVLRCSSIGSFTRSFVQTSISVCA